jgi:hypothetical protein
MELSSFTVSSVARQNGVWVSLSPHLPPGLPVRFVRNRRKKFREWMRVPPRPGFSQVDYMHDDTVFSESLCAVDIRHYILHDYQPLC